uniref:7,8-dihydroneopterin aldolase n=1 Tax=Chlamydomonas euryale TaxID=1486919 RepID=A0A7R9VZE2_9CHLO|mmetsp:Transcript_7745/g.23271  ORF Transcript_7745/g.23271 Transcript_7745/m.23271 type:complete len:151 (+) Transcript_7745:189-641(+)
MLPHAALHAPCSVRSVASSTSAAEAGLPTDKIHLLGARFYGYHGALPEENVLGQPFEVDTTVTCDLRMAGQTDHLDATVNYAKVHNIVKDIVTGPPRQLIESVAEAICARVLEEHKMVHSVRVYVRKLNIPAVPAVVQSVGVEMERSRTR